MSAARETSFLEARLISSGFASLTSIKAHESSSNWTRASASRFLLSRQILKSLIASSTKRRPKAFKSSKIFFGGGVQSAGGDSLRVGCNDYAPYSLMGRLSFWPLFRGGRFPTPLGADNQNGSDAFQAKRQFFIKKAANVFFIYHAFLTLPSYKNYF